MYQKEGTVGFTVFILMEGCYCLREESRRQNANALQQPPKLITIAQEYPKDNNRMVANRDLINKDENRKHMLGISPVNSAKYSGELVSEVETPRLLAGELTEQMGDVLVSILEQGITRLSESTL